jgi:hypothetical protein
MPQVIAPFTAARHASSWEIENKWKNPCLRNGQGFLLWFYMVG